MLLNDKLVIAARAKQFADPCDGRRRRDRTRPIDRAYRLALGRLADERGAGSGAGQFLDAPDEEVGRASRTRRGPVPRGAEPERVPVRGLTQHEPSRSTSPLRRDFLRQAGARVRRRSRSRRCSPRRAVAAPLAARLQSRSCRRSRTSPAKAKSVIFLFMEGGPSHVDLFDPKPELTSGCTASRCRPASARSSRRWAPAGTTCSPASGSSQKHGKSGLDFSRLAAAHGEARRRLRLLRACQADGLNHVGRVCQMNTGQHPGRPAEPRVVGAVRPRHA